MMHMAIRINLQALYDRIGKRQTEIAQAAGVTDGYLTKLKTGEIKGVSFEKLEALCVALDCTPGDLITLAEG